MSEPGYPGESLLSSDKRNRHPNWTDAEIIRFLDLLQEEPTMRDLVAQRNKQVYNYKEGRKVRCCVVIIVSVYAWNYIRLRQKKPIGSLFIISYYLLEAPL